LKSDQELIQAIVKGDRQAFSTLYERYAERVYNTAISYAKNSEEAQDITQEVFVKIHRSAASFKGNAAVNTWVYRIVVNTSLNHLDKQKRKKDTESYDEQYDRADFNHPGVLLENKENAAALFAVIDQLADQQKTAFILSFVEELPRQEVADIMKTSLKAVESLLQRAKQNLRKDLEKMYPHRRKSKK